MLPLDSPRWRALRGAYGDATALPSALRQLASGDQAAAEALTELTGSVYHQGSIYSASFAAVPHLVRVAAEATDPGWRAQVLILVGLVRGSTDDRSSRPLPEDLLGWYAASLPAALDLAIATLREPLDETVALYLLQAAAALNDLPALGRVLEGFADTEFTPTCPSCERLLYIWVKPGGLFVAAEDPVAHPRTSFSEVAPDFGEHTADLSWLMARCDTPSLLNVKQLLPALFGASICPACGCSFRVLDGL